MAAKVLIVEDDRIVQLDLQHRLERLGHAVVGVAASGEDAVTLAAELHPDLVIMDIQLEGKMNGLEAARAIQAKHDVQVLFLTAFAARFDDGNSTIPRPCLSKPYHTDELREVVTELLASKA